MNSWLSFANNKVFHGINRINNFMNKWLKKLNKLMEIIIQKIMKIKANLKKLKLKNESFDLIYKI